MLRQLDPKTLVAGQIAPGDLPQLKAQGVTLLVNNRPDNEEPGQPLSAEFERAAAEAGVEYRHVPVVRGIGPAEVEAMREALTSVSEGKLLAFCRSGYRSTLCWAVACREQGVPRKEVERCAAEAGFSLTPIDHLL
jgi:uncharacterized protein (TIGR01244 family)